MPQASIIVPAFNAASTLQDTLASLLGQTITDFEIIIVNDGSSDDTLRIARLASRDRRVRVISQANRGLAGARNSGIAAATAPFIGFCDADDLWEPNKLEIHLDHLTENPDLGVSYSGSSLIDEAGQRLGISQTPKCHAISAVDVLKRNPIGNGSAAVFRRQALEDIAYRPAFETKHDWVFDETFRQSEDLECWLRMSLTTDWQFEGVPGLLTRYRVNASGLSSALDNQLAAWERAIAKLRPLNPAFFRTHEHAARAYQLRYLARRAFSNQQPVQARQLMFAAMKTSLRPFVEEPLKSLSTLAACLMPPTVGARALAAVRHIKPLP